MSTKPDPTASSVLTVANQRAALLIGIVATAAIGLSMSVLAEPTSSKGFSGAVAMAAFEPVPVVGESTVPVLVTDPALVAPVIVAADPLSPTPVVAPQVASAANAPVGAAPSPAATSAQPAATAAPAANPADTTAPAPTAPGATAPATTAPRATTPATPAPTTAAPTTAAPTTAAPTTAAPTTAAPTTAAPTTAAPTTAASTVPPTTVPPTNHVYDFAGVATSIVIAQYADRHIQFVSMSKEPGWVSRIETNGPNSVVLKFFNTTTSREAQFVADVEGSLIRISKES